MLALEDVPPPHPLTTVALLGLAALLWLFARLQILRRQLAAGDPARPGVTRIRFLHRLAAWRGANALLATAALALGALLWWSLTAI